MSTNQEAHKIKINSNNINYHALFWQSKQFQSNDVAIVYYHGLNGKTKIVKPLLQGLNQYDFYAIEQRGHKGSGLKTSTNVKKHIQDIDNVVTYLKTKYNKIYLCGESMGALYISLYGYKFPNKVNGIFAWSIPFYPKDIMKEKKSTKFKIFIRVFLCFLFKWNYYYSAKVDYPKLSNSKFLLKLNEMNVDTKSSCAEEIAIWKGSLQIKRLFKHSQPKTPIFYWQGDLDIMSNNKLLMKIQKKNYVYASLIPNAKHILMYEPGFDIIVQFIQNHINNH